MGEKTFNDAARGAMKVSGCSAAEIADASGVTRDTIWRIIGNKQRPKRSTARLMAMTIRAELNEKIRAHAKEIKELQNARDALVRAYVEEYGED